MFPPSCPFFFRCAFSTPASPPAGPSLTPAARRSRIAASRTSGYPAVWPQGSAEGWQSGRMRRSRKPFRAVRSDEGSNPSPSAFSSSAMGSQLPAEPGFCPAGAEAPAATALRQEGAHGGNLVSPDLAPGHRCDHPERLGSRGDLTRQRIVGGIERDVLPAGEEADEIPPVRRPVIADRAPQGRLAGRQGVEDRALRGKRQGVAGDRYFDD